jgi:hypothetical protein
MSLSECLHRGVADSLGDDEKSSESENFWTPPVSFATGG